MAARLTAGALDAARPALARLVVHDVLLQGRRPLDRLLCVKARDQDGWPRRLLPHLDKADAVLEADEFVLLSFAAPVVHDCAELGGLLPLACQNGVLASAELSVGDRTLSGALGDQLVLVLGGERRAVPISAFQRLDVAGLWDLASARSVPSAAMPRLVPDPLRTRPLRTRTAVRVEPGDAEAGFSEIGRRLRRPVKLTVAERLWRAWWRFRVGPVPSTVARLVVLAALIVAGQRLAVLLAQGGAAALLELLKAVGTFLASNALPLLLVISVFLLARRGRLRRLREAGETAQPVRPGSTAAPRLSLWRRLRSFFRARSRQIPSGPAPAAAAGQAPPRSRGLLGRLGAWLIWHTPAANRIAREYEKRLAEVEDLFRQGRIEEALRKAIALGGGERGHNLRRLLEAYGDIPLQGPGMRERLDIAFSEPRKPNGLGLSPEGFARLSAIYRQKARDLVAAGELEHAVFIHAELLDDPAGAVDLLVRAGKFETAARLAQARRLPPGLFIPLWFRAGNKERALALAAQHDAFQELWKELRTDDPFRPVLAKAWAERLIAVGHYARALAITDADTDLLAQERRTWLREALAANPDGIIVARALKSLAWTPGDAAGANAALQALLTGGPALEADRLALAHALVDAKIELRAHASMAQGRRAFLAHALVRRLAADEAEVGHRAERARLAATLAEVGGQYSLRVDLRRLGTVRKPEAAVVRLMNVPSSPPLAVIIDAVQAGARHVLIGYRSGLLRLVDFAGRERWRDQVNGLIALVPVGEGHKVLVLRDEFGERTLSVVDVLVREHRVWGPFPATSFHRAASEAGWLIMAGRDIMMVDIPALIAGPPTGDAGEPPLRHWAIPMSEEGRPIFFIERLRDVNFAYARTDGLVEWWRIDKATLKIDYELWTDPPRQEALGEWMAFVNEASPAPGGRAFLLMRGQQGVGAVTLIPATRQAELDLLAKPMTSPLPALLTMAGMATAQAVRWTASPQAQGLRVDLSLPAGATFKIDMAGARRAWVNPHPSAPNALVFDDVGRVLVVDVAQAAVLVQLI